jgi:hypothetical protein
MTATRRLDQARYWRNVLLVHANRGSMTAFIESCEPLSRDDGPLARSYLQLARWLKRYLKQEASLLEKAVRRAARSGLHAPVYEFFDGMPCVRGDYSPLSRPSQLVWPCPHCGEVHRLPWHPPGREELMACEKDPAAFCVVEITTLLLPLMITAYVPRPRQA